LVEFEKLRYALCASAKDFCDSYQEAMTELEVLGIILFIEGSLNVFSCLLTLSDFVKTCFGGVPKDSGLTDPAGFENNVGKVFGKGAAVGFGAEAGKECCKALVEGASTGFFGKDVGTGAATGAATGVATGFVIVLDSVFSVIVSCFLCAGTIRG